MAPDEPTGVRTGRTSTPRRDYSDVVRKNQRASPGAAAAKAHEALEYIASMTGKVTQREAMEHVGGGSSRQLISKIKVPTNPTIAHPIPA